MNKSDAIRDRLLRFFHDPETGLIFSNLDRNTLKPPAPELFAEARNAYPVPGFSMADIYRHENFGMCTGGYICSEVLRFRRSGEEGVLRWAVEAFEALYRIYRMGMRLGAGFFPKPYGGRFSPETSTDQVLYACVAMEALHPVAPPPVQRRIEEMMVALVDFWRRRDYRYHYFNAFGDDWQWPLVRFPSLLLLAWQFSGREELLREYERLLPLTTEPEHDLLNRKRAGRIPLLEWERRNHGYMLFAASDRTTMDTMQFDILLRRDPGNALAPAWRNNLEIMWREGAPALAPDGKCYGIFSVDFTTGATRRIPPGETESGRPVHGAASGWSTMIVRAGMQIAAHLPHLAGEILPAVRNVLAKLDFEELSYFDEPERFDAGARYKANLLSGDAAVNYLWCAELLRQYEAARPVSRPQKQSVS